MKTVKTVLAVLICLTFVSSGLHGFGFCGVPDEHLFLKAGQNDAHNGHCSHGHEHRPPEREQSSSLCNDNNCCYQCNDIPFHGTGIPECTERKAKISNERLEIGLNTAPLLFSIHHSASAFKFPYSASGTETRPDRTVVLRI